MQRSDETRARISAAKLGRVTVRHLRHGITQEIYDAALRDGLRWCSGCKKFKQPNEFYGTSRATYCKECQKPRRKHEYASLTAEQHKRRKELRNSPETREWRKNYNADYMAALSPEERSKIRRRASLKNRYKTTPEEYDKKLAGQNSCCACCGRPMGARRFAVDHDHTCCPQRESCGKCTRGLVCQRCNVLIGIFESIVASGLVLKIPQYLAKYKEKRNGDT